MSRRQRRILVRLALAAAVAVLVIERYTRPGAQLGPGAAVESRR